MSITYTIIAEKMVFGGDCISKVNGKNVFIPYAIPGEELEIEITEERRDYCHSKIVKVLKPSPHRVEPFCPLYGKCGGCNMQHIDSKFQSELRASILRDTFAREGINVENIEIVGGNPFNYRSRFQFHDGGLMERSSNNIIPIDNCPCAVDEINNWLKNTKFNLRPKGRVHVFASNKICERTDKVIIAKEENVEAVTPKVKGKKQIKPRFSGTVINPQNICSVVLKDKKLTFDVQGFFQSNLDVLEKTIDKVTENLSGKNVLDMYSGAGTFSVFLADKFEKVTLVEHNRDALVFAEQNMAGKKHESYGVSGEKWVLNHSASCINANGQFDAIVVDPPRSGMEKAVCQWICSSSIPSVRSISCDSATHARDAKFLIRSGYILKKLYLLDFYPQTGHIESLAVFEKAPSED